MSEKCKVCFNILPRQNKEYCSMNCRTTGRRRGMDEDQQKENGLKCKTCDAPLRGYQQKYCSEDCKAGTQRKRTMEPRYCKKCGDKLKNTRRKYCSDSCRASATTERREKRLNDEKPEAMVKRILEMKENTGKGMTGKVNASRYYLIKTLLRREQRINKKLRIENRYLRWKVEERAEKTRGKRLSQWLKERAK